MQGQEGPQEHLASSELTTTATPATKDCSIIASILADCRTANQRAAIDRAISWFAEGAPGKLDELDAAIRQHLPKHHQKRLMRDYLTMAATVNLLINLDDTIRTVRAIDPDDKIWN